MVTVVMCNYLPSLSKKYFFLGTRGGGGCRSLGIFLFWPLQGNFAGMSCLPFFCHLQNVCCIFYCYDLLCLGLGAS